MATFSPTSAFSSVLLPALGRPKIETNPDFKTSLHFSNNAGAPSLTQPYRV
jgi:hypothetical protein